MIKAKATVSRPSHNAMAEDKRTLVFRKVHSFICIFDLMSLYDERHELMKSMDLEIFT